MKTTLRAFRTRSPLENLFKNVLLIAVLALASWSPKPAAPVATGVIIRGSNTFGEELAPKLIAEFKKDHPQATFDTEFKGTPYGFGALMVDKCDIAAASREVNANELNLAKDRQFEFNSYVVGSYSVAVILNSGNSLASLTTDQVRDIFTGKIQNWKEVGGPDAPVHIYIRDPVSGTYLGFQELAMEKKDYAQHPKTFTSYAGIVDAVGHDPAGIGYASIEDVTKSGIKGVAIGGSAPTLAEVQNGKYPYTRVVRLFTNKAKESPSAMDFIHFIQSEKGQKLITDMGFVPRT